MFPTQENDLNDVMNCQDLSTPTIYLNSFSQIAFRKIYGLKCLHCDQNDVLTSNGTYLNFHINSL